MYCYILLYLIYKTYFVNIDFLKSLWNSATIYILFELFVLFVNMQMDLNYQFL
ncbi:hypothetical protein GLOIN_2v1714964 [Rhizophagus irregularis DAOM 181602=DAOM 197198]|uniref:Uncharacterized protein n=1 Tax=Rhizophagus irregularis (strain DAOM 181602 / DAOM 197198 / MUCL 43194) TaxID=747089 RepID=A0A2P4P4I3_RHIID|nr:hypothetical protein GLOIN_2v1714964 [Rhizophagus irregularis DAOM 181602=DAOM 197198]POG60291.1 hypothetical protein GLOIN_2v1714964 [Rhizophagus irregularis DAOM 181602=DAOM 197198]|eukprot:XP_025167157.1 hypothetical protein GLOIN_2v1714964 [Rhizophagus irregularis DAOM 181602=DAOM 197198]